MQIYRWHNTIPDDLSFPAGPVPFTDFVWNPATLTKVPVVLQ